MSMTAVFGLWTRKTSEIPKTYGYAKMGVKSRYGPCGASQAMSRYRRVWRNTGILAQSRDLRYYVTLADIVKNFTMLGYSSLFLAFRITIRLSHVGCIVARYISQLNKTRNIISFEKALTNATIPPILLVAADD